MTQRTTPLSESHPVTTTFGSVGDATVALRYAEDCTLEYTALRERAGVVDLGGATLVKIAGTGAHEFLQTLLARDVEYLTPERSITSLILDSIGHIVDLVLVWGHDEGAVLESTVGGGARLLEHLRTLPSDSVDITDLTEESTVISIEGPYSWGVVGRLIDPELAALPLDSVVEAVWSDVDVLFTRSGSTGEYGYKVIVPVEKVAALWSLAVAEATPIGHDALELAMLEVRHPVLHREITPGTGVVESGLGWFVDFTKPNFVGKDALVAEFESGEARRTIGFECESNVPSSGISVTIGDTTIGEIVYAIDSLGTGKVLGLARIDSEFAAAGLVLTAGGSSIRTVSSPYITPKSWSIPIV